MKEKFFGISFKTSQLVVFCFLLQITNGEKQRNVAEIGMLLIWSILYSKNIKNRRKKKREWRKENILIIEELKISWHCVLRELPFPIIFSLFFFLLKSCSEETALPSCCMKNVHIQGCIVCDLISNSLLYNHFSFSHLFLLYQ